MLIDTHAHLNFAAFNKDRDQVIGRCLDNDTWMINVGTNLATSQKAVEIAQKYEEGVYAAVGLHPINIDQKPKTKDQKQKMEAEDVLEENFDFEKYKRLAQQEKVVAIGEIGLDYYQKPKTAKKKALFKQAQKELFLKELELARELNLPVIFHCRMAHQDLREILTSNSQLPSSSFRGVIHSFVGSLKELQAYLKLGFYIGYNGIIFKEIEGIDFNVLIKATPLAKILVETDCPFLTPPQRGERRNEPLFVKDVAERIAEIKGVSFEEVAKATTQNARALFLARPGRAK